MSAPILKDDGKPFFPIVDGLLVVEAVQKLDRRQVREWLDARMRNCLRISMSKTGEDKRGWLDDAAYFAAAVGLIDWTEDGQS